MKKTESKRLRQTRRTLLWNFTSVRQQTLRDPGGCLIGIIALAALYLGSILGAPLWNSSRFTCVGTATHGRGGGRNQTNIRGNEVSFVSFVGWDSALAPHMEEWKRGEDVVIGRCENVQRTHPSGRQHWTLKPTRNLKPPAGILHTIFTFMGYISLLGTHQSGVTIMATNYGVWEDGCALTLCGVKEQARPERGKKVEIGVFLKGFECWRTLGDFRISS